LTNVPRGPGGPGHNSLKLLSDDAGHLIITRE
jgi:hypothetical protein